MIMNQLDDIVKRKTDLCSNNRKADYVLRQNMPPALLYLDTVTMVSSITSVHK